VSREELGQYISVAARTVDLGAIEEEKRRRPQTAKGPQMTATTRKKLASAKAGEKPKQSMAETTVSPKST
jgi:hypothetical protein